MKNLAQEVRVGANMNCFHSYRLRELTFCVSPALIAMAAVDMKLKDGCQLRIKHPEVCQSLRNLLAFSLQDSPGQMEQMLGPNPDMVWAKIADIQSKI